MKIRYPMDTCVYCCWTKTILILVDGWFIECISLLVLQDQNNEEQNNEEQIRNSQTSASRLTSDREELIAKKLAKIIKQ